MKKLLLTLVIAAGTAVSAFAQFDCGDFDVNFGYRGCLGDQCFGTSLHGAYIGTNFTFTELLGPVDLGIGFKFGQSMAAAAYKDVLVTDTLLTATQDFQFPLYLRILIDLGGCDLLFRLGPTFNCGLNLQNRLKDNFYGQEYKFDFYRDVNAEGGSTYWKFQRFDILADVGVGFVFGERFRLEADFGYGCLARCIEDYKNYGGAVNPNSHNMELTVGIAYAFK